MISLVKVQYLSTPTIDRYRVSSVYNSPLVLDRMLPNLIGVKDGLLSLT